MTCNFAVTPLISMDKLVSAERLELSTNGLKGHCFAFEPLHPYLILDSLPLASIIKERKGMVIL